MSAAPINAPVPVPPTAQPAPGPRLLVAAGPSLFVGDLSPEVSETILFNAFREVAPVASVRVCRNALTRDSLGYAYVNLSNPTDCERVIKELNYKLILDRPCRIMISQRDPGLRRTHVGNVFVKNLATSLTTRELYETFSVFGAILSCKIPSDEGGKSKGYGFVHFQNEEAATAAVRDAHDMLFMDRKLSVQPYVPRNQRTGGVEWNNVFIKNIPKQWNEAELIAAFKGFGDIISAAIQKDGGGAAHKGFGFVSFRDHEAASRAVEGMHDKEVDGEPATQAPAAPAVSKKAGGDAAAAEGDAAEVPKKTAAAAAAATTVRLYVSRALKKAERERAMKDKRELSKRERDVKFTGCNLYVRNIDESMDDAKLRAEFAPFGTITSASVQRDAAGRSRLFGYVCFATPEDATKAQAALSGKLFQGKPLYVVPWQPKEARQAANARRPALAARAAAGAGVAGQQPQQLQGAPQQLLQQQLAGPNAQGTNPLAALMAQLANPQMQAFLAQMNAGGNPGAVHNMMLQMMMMAMQQQNMAAMAGRGGQPGMQPQQMQQPGMPQQQQRMPTGPMAQQMQQQQPRMQLTPQQQMMMPPQQQAAMQQQQQGMRRGMPQQQGMLPMQQMQPQQQMMMAQQGPAGARVASGPGGGAPRGAPQQQPQQQQARGAQQQQRPGSSQMLPGARNPMTATAGVPAAVAGVPPAAVAQVAQQLQQHAPAPQAAAPVDAGESFTSRLASASPEQAKHMIGERLFALISKTQPERAGKITGMLLEGIEELSELLHLLESPTDLQARVMEALEVLARAGQA